MLPTNHAADRTGKRGTEICCVQPYNTHTKAAETHQWCSLIMTGRPSLTFSRTRAAAAKAVEEDESSLSTAMSYRRRFPKLGSQFQAKVPKTTSITPYATERPVPVLMSNLLPHLTKEEASVYIKGDTSSGKSILSCKCLYRGDRFRLVCPCRSFVLSRRNLS